jgi:hypothetical protein
VKFRASGVLAHNPGYGVADFLQPVVFKPDCVGIESFSRSVLAGHALAQLYESMLNVTRLLFIVQVLHHLIVRQLPSKPCASPEEKRQQHDCPCDQEEEKAAAKVRFRLSGRLRWGNALRIQRFWCHVSFKERAFSRALSNSTISELHSLLKNSNVI